MAYTIKVAGGDTKRLPRRLTEKLNQYQFTVLEEIRHYRITKVRKNGRHLTPEQWKEFNAGMNDALDDAGISADVTSTPFDHHGTMWIRKGDKRV